MIKVVVFDFDDTLCLTEEATFHIENKIAAEMGFPPMSRQAHQKNWGRPIVEAIPQRFPGIDVEEFVRREELYVSKHAASGELDLVPECNLKILNDLKKEGKKLAIVTNRTFNEVKHLLHDEHPFSSVLDAFYHRDNSDFLKPDPRVFNSIFLKFQVKPQECVYIGDAVNDGIAAKNAGMHFIAVLESGLRKKDDFIGIPVDYFADNFIDISKHLQTI